MQGMKAGAIVMKGIALGLLLGTAWQAMAQGAKTPYPNMAPVDQYLMEDREAEIALARSAAPESISREAEVMVLGRHGSDSLAGGWRNAVSVKSQWQDEAPTRSLRAHDRAQNLRMPSRQHPLARPAEFPLRAASRGEIHAA